MDDPVEDWQYVLDFWFGDAGDDAEVARRQSGLWWGKSVDSDELIWAKFSHRVEQVSAGALPHWLESPEGRLAAIIVIDQFRRVIYRNDPGAFAEDALARRWCREGLQQGLDRSLRPIERVFFYMPLEHSEDLDDQNLSVDLFGALYRAVASEQRDVFANFLNFAERHRDVIERFGRFPHRNAILDRQSTAEELAFLQQPGSSF